MLLGGTGDDDTSARNSYVCSHPPPDLHHPHHHPRPRPPPHPHHGHPHRPRPLPPPRCGGLELRLVEGV
eukprot:45475-Rhodomonas_salina.1